MKGMSIALKRKLKKGEIICRHKENLLALKWTDKRDVSILSTKHTSQCSVLLNKVDRNTGDPVSKPSAILDFIWNMGGVDLSDQLNKYYSMTRRTWKLLFLLFNLAVTNAYIIYKKVARSPVTHFQFRCEFIRYLLDSDVQRNPRGKKRSVEDNNKPLNEKTCPKTYSRTT